MDIQEYTEIELGDPEEIKAGIVPKYIKQHHLTFTLVGSNNKLKLTSYKLLNDPEDPDPESIKNAVPVPPEAVPAIIDTLQSSSSSLLNSSVPSNLVKHQYSWQVNPILASSSIPITNVIERSSSPYKELHKNNFGLLPSLNKNLVAQLRTVYFDRTGTLEYARRWWSGFNPKYRNFERVFGLPFYNAGDCTNYASQICTKVGNGQWWVTMALELAI